MQVSSTNRTLGGLLGQLAPRRAGEAQSRGQITEFERHIGGEESRRTDAVKPQGQDSTNSGRVIACSETGTSVPQGGAAPAAKAAAPPASPVVARPAELPFAPSGPSDPTPAAPWPVNIVTPSVLPELAHQAKAALANAMAETGLDPSRFRVSYWEELVSYPGGNYINRNLTVEGPTGQKTDFDAAWTLKTPWVTARELREQATA